MPNIQLNDQDIEAAPFDDLAHARQFATDDHIVVKNEDIFYVVDGSYEDELRENGYEKV